MFEVRSDEPDYAKLSDQNTQTVNRYGFPIQLIDDGSGGVSLRINNDEGIGSNPHRDKQHGFHFTADNCIGCHACEAACSEKNNLPPHLAFRSVGYVEGGTFPDYTRMNISMACNHCDNPVCLKGCPTRAYTKHPEYGAVIQDPNICFGCGYCTWVCPYNAPQLDPVNGQVEKCNMCVDRLEVGLKPACVSACVGNALDFGVVENVPDRREQIDTRIPGFPDPSITQPNIRFQQVKTMPREVTRTDVTPLKYKRDDDSGFYRPMVDQKAGKAKHWNISRLSSRENPLVIFTLAVQAAFGLFSVLNLGAWLGSGPLMQLKASAIYAPLVAVSVALTGLGLLMSTTHIGKPLRFYRGFNNLRHSPVCREGLGVLLFMVFGGLHFLSLLPSHPWVASFFSYDPAQVAGAFAAAASVFAVLAVLSGAVGVYYMYRCYRIPARPFWNHWSTGTHFLGNAISLGSCIAAVIGGAFIAYTGGAWVSLLAVLAAVAALGVVLEAIGLWRQAAELNHAQHEGAASHYVQSTTFGHTYVLRNVLLGVAFVLAGALAVLSLPSVAQWLAWLGLLLCLSVTALFGRALFYVLVIPTTMPGAFFWRNKGFEEHARDIGLDHNPSSGVVPLAH